MGNIGNMGNGQQNRGLQPFPIYKKSGNNGEHTPKFQYKSAFHSLLLVMTVPHQNGWGINGGRYNPRIHWLFPVFPLFPTFLKLEEHVYVSNPGMVTP